MENKARASSQTEIEDFCESIGLQREAGEFMWCHWEENGWKRGKQPVKNWRMAVRTWKAGGFLDKFKASKSHYEKASDYRL